MKHPFFKLADLGKHAVSSGAVNGTAVDMRDFDEHCHVVHSIHNVAKSAARKLNGTLQHSDASASGFTDVEGTAITEVGNVDTSIQKQVLQIGDLKRYVRVRYVPTSSGASFVAFCSVIGWKDPKAA